MSLRSALRRTGPAHLSDGQLVEVTFDDGTSTETTGFSWDNNRPIPQIITWTDTTNTNLIYGNTRLAATGGTTGDETFAYNPPVRIDPGFNVFAAFASTACACEDNGGATCATALLLNLSTFGGRGLEASPAVQRLLGGSGTSALSVEQNASIQIGLIFYPFNELTLYTARVYLD